MPECIAQSLPLVENVDYEVDYANGLIRFPSTGAMGPTVAEFAAQGYCGVAIEVCFEEEVTETPVTGDCTPPPDCHESISDPSCPAGYVWGGTACVRAAASQACSPGYFWNGTQCILGASIVCAPGYSLSGGICTLCTVPAFPTLTPGPGQISVDFNVGLGLPYNVFRSVDGQNYNWVATDVGIGGSESFNDTDVAEGQTYYYYVSVYLGNECGYVDGNVNSVIAT